MQWDGRRDDGLAARAAATLSVSATTGDGRAVAVSQDVTGTVTRVSFDRGYAQLTLDSGVEAPSPISSASATSARAPPEPTTEVPCRCCNAANAGVSGLATEGSALGVVNDNVANINTVGFKRSRSVFETVLGGAVGRPDALARASRMARTQQIFAQGALLTTGQPTDLALSGDGFFVVQGAVDGVPGRSSRAGQATVNNQGTLVNPQGLALQGYAANGDGTFASSTSALSIPAGGIPARDNRRGSPSAPTSTPRPPPRRPLGPRQPAATSNPLHRDDGVRFRGGAHTVSVYFRRTGANAWSTTRSPTAARSRAAPVGQQRGRPARSPSARAARSRRRPPRGRHGELRRARARPGAAFNFGTPAGVGGTGLDGITQFGSASNVTAQSQDRYAAAA